MNEIDLEKELASCIAVEFRDNADTIDYISDITDAYMHIDYANPKDPVLWIDGIEFHVGDIVAKLPCGEIIKAEREAIERVDKADELV